MRAVFFDLDGTLLHATREYRDVLADAVRDVIGWVPRDVLDRYDEVFFSHFEAMDPDPVRRTFASIQLDAEPAALADALLAQEIAACEPPPDAHADLTRLAESYQIGVLTNGVRAWQLEKLRAYELDGYFDAIVTSYEAGAHKPAVAPFRFAERRVPADAYAMVGDDEVDLRGASNAGWTALLYEGDGFGAIPGALDWG